MRFGKLPVSTASDDEDRAGLCEKLVHRRLAGAGDGLIGRDDDAGDLRRVMQRLQRDDELRGRAIRIGDDVLLGVFRDGIGIHFRHDQRHIRVHAPGRGIIDHNRALATDLRRPFLRDRAACRHQADVGAGEIVIFERFADERPVAEGHVRADRARRGERDDFIGGKPPLGEDIEHFTPDIAGGADDGDLETHFILLCGTLKIPQRRPYQKSGGKSSSNHGKVSPPEIVTKCLKAKVSLRT